MEATTPLTFSGQRLLREQEDLLAQSTPADINYLQFLKLKRSAQQKATAQRNQYRHTSLGADGETPENLSVARQRGSTGGGSTSFAYEANPIGGNSETGAEADYPPAAVLGSSSPPASLGATAPAAAVPAPTPGIRAAFLPAAAVASAADCIAARNTANSFDDLPASVTKRHSMGDSFFRPGGGVGGHSVDSDRHPAMASGMGSGALDSVPEQAGGEMVKEECPHCGRTFAEGRLERHIDTCRRQQEREQDAQRRKPGNRTAPQRGSVVSSLSSLDGDRAARDGGKALSVAPAPARRRTAASAKAASDDL